MAVLPRNRHKMNHRPSLRPVVLTILGFGLYGCARAGAPSFEFFGAYFPAWMLCALAGIAGAAGARAALTRPRLLGAIPYPLPVCTAVGTVVALFAWLLLFR